MNKHPSSFTSGFVLTQKGSLPHPLWWTVTVCLNNNMIIDKPDPVSVTVDAEKQKEAGLAIANTQRPSYADREGGTPFLYWKEPGSRAGLVLVAGQCNTSV